MPSIMVQRIEICHPTIQELLVYELAFIEPQACHDLYLDTVDGELNSDQ